MSQTKQALLWAGALLAIAILTVLELIPEGVAQYAVIALPLLAWLGIMPHARCCTISRKTPA